MLSAPTDSPDLPYAAHSPLARTSASVVVVTHESDLQHLREQTTALAATLGGLVDDDLTHPSLCRGWTRAHVVAHLARNADGIGNLVRQVHGSDVTMYVSNEARNADIEAGATRPARDNLADALRVGDQVVVDLATITPADAEVTVQRLPGVEFGTAGQLAGRRLREVVYHHVDLDAGFSFADVPTDLLRIFLDLEVARLRRDDRSPGLVLRSTEGDRWTVGDGSHEVTGPRAGLLTWVARGIPDLLDPQRNPNPPQLPEGP